jgi:filamentous hemagglutinin family protein
MNHSFRPMENDRPAACRSGSDRPPWLEDQLWRFGGLPVCWRSPWVRPPMHSPTGGAVSAGAATITTGTTAVTVDQSSQNAAINWQSFGIGTGEAVTFQQPNSNSVALNRVLGADPSAILGSLSANGKIFLVNPNGILFAKGAQVNVGGLVASTLGITDANFMAGNYQFAGSSTGKILNRGSINADGGYVALLGARVTNKGVITARLGTVALAGGNAVTLDVGRGRVAQCHRRPRRGERARQERRSDSGEWRTGGDDR